MENGLDTGEHLVYIDKMELANLDGGYESAKGVRNCYWASYYKWLASSKFCARAVPD